MDILIVDDDKFDREILRRSLKTLRQNAVISEATSVDAAAKLCETQRFDAILLDYRMPVRDGIELVKELS